MALVDFSQNPSLNQIVSSLAARVNKQHDVGFMDELKHIVDYKRSAAIHEWLISMPQSWHYFLQSFVIGTEKADATECVDLPTSCFIYRTTSTIQEPLRDARIKSAWQLFDFVGSESGYRPYQWYQPEYINIMRAAKYTSKSRKWFWKNGRVYIIDLTGIEPGNIQIRGVFENALTIQQCDISSPPEDVRDDDPYPVPRELISNIIADIMKTELSTGDTPKEDDQEKDEMKIDSIEKIEHSNT